MAQNEISRMIFMAVSLIILLLGVIGFIWGLTDFNKWIFSGSFYQIHLPIFALFLISYALFGLFLSYSKSNVGILAFGGLATLSLVYRIAWSILLIIWGYSGNSPYRDWYFMLVELAIVISSVLYFIFGSKERE